MKKFLDKNFLLETKTAEKLYHQHAAKMPIIDYHCHLNPEEISSNKKFENLTQIWLYGDHYKWRAMRSNGIDERYCTGDASDYEKFEKWAETVPYTLRNPLYHWTHLELRDYFGINELLSPKTAKKIYKKASDLLQQDDYSVQNLLKKMNVEMVCTTDDPIDSLEYHKKIKKDNIGISVFPTWRPDKAMAVDNIDEYNTYLNNLGEVADVNIIKYSDLVAALQKRHKYFEKQGCRLSDHGIDVFYAEDYSENEIKSIFNKIRSANSLSKDEIAKFKSSMLLEFGLMDYESGWTQQFHYGAMRNNNTRMFCEIGPDTGFDSIADQQSGKAMSTFFDRLDRQNKLAQTIIYNLNPRDNYLVGTMIGNFQDGITPGKIQFGSGWWFMDQKEGMEWQMNALSNLGLLSRFVGMLTDSRSFLSYPRHEYFRRILCNLLGNDVENGELPADMELIGSMVENICYNNANNFFGFKTS
jgi:glucuronate isomerase